jgi:CBS domain-containing protein
MKAQEVMTPKPVCCGPADSVQDVALVMREHDCGCVPIVDPDTGVLIGVVTDRDLAVRGLASGRGAHARVGELMTELPACCTEDDDITAVERVMADRQVRRVPIVDAEGCCTGIVSQADVARAALNGGSVTDHDVATVVERVSRPSRWRVPWSNYQPPL